ncbi:MAG: VanZ family protein [Fimbriimonadales bacterium]
MAGCGAGFALVLVLAAALGPSAQGVALACLAVAASAWVWSSVPGLRRTLRFGGAAAHAAGFAALWMLGDRPSGAPAGFKVGLVVGCSLAGLALLIVARRLSGWGPISAAIGATLGAWLVAAFSGSQGAAGSYPGWLEALFGLDPATAEAVSTLSRKVVHFVFYGTFGLLHLLALSHMGRREAVGASWVVVVLYAWTDETRQMGTTVRWGSPWDVLLDLTGAAAFTLVWVLRKRSPQR